MFTRNFSSLPFIVQKKTFTFAFSEYKVHSLREMLAKSFSFDFTRSSILG